MKARKCDRCGKFYDDYKPTEETKNANALRLMGATQASAHHGGWYDLCEGCMKDLVTLLDTPPKAPEEPVEPPVSGGEPVEPPVSGGEPDPTPDPTEPENPGETPVEGKGGV